MCREHDIVRWVPDPPEGLIGFEEAVRLALVRIRDADVATHWSNASVVGASSDPMPSDPDWAQATLYVDERARHVDAPPEVLWSVVEGIGGDAGWYSWSTAWTVRGLIDRLSGGPGLRRGRRNPYDLQLGDAVDWWRVEEIVDGELLRLRAEMRLPGRAWLDLGIVRDAAGGTVLHQRAVFAPRGLWGRIYWWAVWPFHGLVFGGMQRNIAARAESAAAVRSRAMGWEQLHAGIELPIDPAITIPRLTEVELAVPEVDPVGDVEAAARDEVTRHLRDAVEVGMTVAVGAGSRGLTGRVELLRGTITALRELGAEPFVVPAMGSHGGATAEGQRAMLAALGVTAESVGAEIRSTMETESSPATPPTGRSTSTSTRPAPIASSRSTASSRTPRSTGRSRAGARRWPWSGSASSPARRSSTPAGPARCGRGWPTAPPPCAAGCSAAWRRWRGRPAPSSPCARSASWPGPPRRS